MVIDRGRARVTTEPWSREDTYKMGPNRIFRNNGFRMENRRCRVLRGALQEWDVRPDIPADATLSRPQGTGGWRSWPRQKVEGGNATACQEGRGQSGWLGPGSGGAVTWLGNCHGEYTNPIGHTATGPFIMLAYTRSPEQFPQKVKTAPPNVINLFSLCWKCDMKNIRRLKKEGPALEST